MLVDFAKGFSYQFNHTSPHTIKKDCNYSIIPAPEQKDNEELLLAGVRLFVKQWGKNEKTLIFDDFSLFFK